MKLLSRPAIAADLSIYLNILRIGAASIVAFVHLANERITGDWLAVLRGPPVAHHAVVVFFVLSGYVIALASERQSSLKDYLTARIARMCSVAIPMVALVPVIDILGRTADPSVYAGWWAPESDAALRIFTALTFSHEVWFASVRYFSNGPYWSIGYEVAYYLLFGMLWFLRGWQRIVAAAVVALAIGPKIMLLFPIWAAGAVLYWTRDHVLFPRWIGAAMIIISVALYAAFVSTGAWDYFEKFGMGILKRGPVAVADWGWSHRWGSDYVLTSIVALNIVGAQSFFRPGERILASLQKPVAWLADASFAIYLFHYPLAHFIAANVGQLKSEAAGAGIVAAGTFAACLLLAEISDRRRREWLAATTAIVSFFSRALRRFPA